MELCDYLYSHMAKKLIKFVIVGMIGTFINLVIFYFAVDVFQINYNISAMIAFGIAVTCNYFTNHSWTFNIENLGIEYNFFYYIKYFVANIAALFINLAILNLLITIFNPSLRVIAQLVGISGGAVFNFICANSIVFKDQKVKGK